MLKDKIGLPTNNHKSLERGSQREKDYYNEIIIIWRKLPSSLQDVERPVTSFLFIWKCSISSNCQKHYQTRKSTKIDIPKSVVLDLLCYWCNSWVDWDHFSLWLKKRKVKGNKGTRVKKKKKWSNFLRFYVIFVWALKVE